MLKRPIPSSGELLPVVGLGTWQVFDVGPGAADRKPLVEVAQAILASGGSVIDSSPMYGRAEGVAGDVIAGLGATGSDLHRHQSLDPRRNRRQGADAPVHAVVEG